MNKTIIIAIIVITSTAFGTMTDFKSEQLKNPRVKVAYKEKEEKVKGN